MIQIENQDAFVILKYGIRRIIFHEMEYSSFKEELFVLRGENKVKIQPQELTFINFNLLYYKHTPFYNKTVSDILDINPLIKKFSWSTK